MRAWGHGGVAWYNGCAMAIIIQSDREVFPQIIGGHYAIPAGHPYMVERLGGRKDWLLLFTLSGSGRVASDDVQVRLRPDTLALIPPQCPQEYRAFSGDTWDFLWIHFFPREEWKPLLDWSERRGEGPRMRTLSLRKELPRRVGRVRRVLRDCVGQAAQDTAFGDAMAMNLLEHALLWCRHALRARQKVGEDAFMQDVRAFVAASLGRPPTLPELAARHGLSPSRFSHRFRKAFGMSPIAYVERCRLEHANRLMSSGICATVKEAAYAVGFSDPAYFSRRYRRLFGQAPIAIRGNPGQ